MRKNRRWMTSFGSVTDHPLTMIDEAIKEVKGTTGRERDNLPLRRAADMAWLAAASTADIVATRLSLDIPKGTNGRINVLEGVEKAYKLHAGELHGVLTYAHEVLHSLSYYEDSPKADKRNVLAAMEAAKKMVSRVLELLDQRPKAGAWRARWRP